MTAMWGVLSITLVTAFLSACSCADGTARGRFDGGSPSDSQTFPLDGPASMDAPSRSVACGEGDDLEGCVCAPNTSRACFTSNPSACGFGTQRCQSNNAEFGVWGPCEGTRTTSAEVCNEIDDDCNGIVDDDCSRVVGANRVAASYSHTCAVLEDGTVRCWGVSARGQLGYGNTNSIGDDETPAMAGAVPVGGLVREIGTGGSFSCALLETGAVRCWGQASNGQLGYGNDSQVGDDETPASVGDVQVGGRVTQLAVGRLHHTCALLESGSIRCWGAGGSGQLGHGNTERIGDDETPASSGDIPLGGRAIQVSAGDSHTCAILESGAVRCWGKNTDGQLGYGHTRDIGDDETPASAGDVPLGGRAIQISAGTWHTCALLDTGAVRCWGSAREDVLGYPGNDTIGDNETPASAGDVPLGERAVYVSAPYQTTCAVLESGGVRCWGLLPISFEASQLGGRAVQVAVGWNHACIALDSGGIRCWGSGAGGQLGYGNTMSVGSPVAVGDVPVR